MEDPIYQNEIKNYGLIKTELIQIFPKTKADLMSIVSLQKLDDDLVYIYNAAVDSLLKNSFSNCFNYTQVLLDKVWEKLNSGHWKNVSVNLRKLYSAACLIKVAAFVFSHTKCSHSKVEKLVETCDMALLLGVNILNELFHKIISILSTQLMCIYDTAAIQISALTSPLLIPNDLNNKIHKEIMPSMELFKKHCLKQKNPLLFLKCIEHWPARGSRKWSFDYLNRIAGFRTVPVEIGSKYTDEGWSQKLMKISDFIKLFVNCESSSPVGYLAQHQLFDQIPELQKDIVIPDYCCISDDSNFDEDIEINAWFGPANTISPCHYDLKKNILVQVVGTKLVKLYPPSANLYPHEGMLTNTSKINVENPDLKQYPLFADAEKDCSSFILNAGDMLYIPPWHWHYIKSLEPSMSVSFWW